MDDLFIGKAVTVIFEETRSVERSGVLVSSDEEGVVVRYEYRRGTRVGFIPRDRLEEIHFDEEKPARKSRKKAKAKVVTRQKPAPAPVVEEPEEVKVEEKEEVLTPVEVAETIEEEAADLADIFSEKEEFDDEGDDEDKEFDEDDDFD